MALTRTRQRCSGNSFHGVTGHVGGNRAQILACNYPPQSRKEQGAVFHPSDSHPRICIQRPCVFQKFVAVIPLFFNLFKNHELAKQKDVSVMVCSVCYTFDAEFHTRGGFKDTESSEFDCRTSKTSCKQHVRSLNVAVSVWLLLMAQRWSQVCHTVVMDGNCSSRAAEARRCGAPCVCACVCKCVQFPLRMPPPYLCVPLLR